MLSSVVPENDVANTYAYLINAIILPVIEQWVTRDARTPDL
jgi:hypothetical protein